MDGHVVPWTSWAFTALTALVLILMLTLSFLRYRRKLQRKREKELEYIARFKMILPGFSYKDLKKTQARKIMTNTHGMTIAEACRSPTAHPSTAPESNKLLAPLARAEIAEDKDLLAAAVSVHHSDTRSPYGVSRRQVPSQNSVDTTTDEEKPLVECDGGGNVTDSAVRDRKYRLRGYSPSLEKTVEHVLHGKRKQKLKSENKERGHGKHDKEFSVRGNFTSTSIDFDDEHKQNYIVYSSNEMDKRKPSEPVVYTFPPHADIEAYSSMPAMAVNNYYIEAGIAPPKHKSKHGKTHKADRQGRKKHRQIGELRARSLPQLDDVYHGNVKDEKDQLGGERGYQDMDYTQQSTSDNTGRVFIKRKPLTSQAASPQGDNTVPLMKMRSFPVISQSEESVEAGFDEATFISEYM